MKVTLIDFTGKGMGNPADYAARLLIFVKNTRLAQSEGELDRIMNQLSGDEVAKQLTEIAMSIRSSWEMVNYTWLITGVTRAFTHQFVRSRHASFAQQAMRVADMSDFESLMPETVKNGNEEIWNKVMNQIKGAYQMLRLAGIPAQDARGVLPTNVLTNIIAQFNLRAFAELVGKRENMRAQGEYADVVRLMKDRVLEVHPWTKPFIDPERTQTPSLDKLLARGLAGRSPVDAPEINAALKEIDLLKGTWG
jgi:flavin-dependent thymidylate synthase